MTGSTSPLASLDERMRMIFREIVESYLTTHPTSRPRFVRETMPARSSTDTCLETAAVDMLKGAARSVMRSCSSRSSIMTIERRVVSPSAEKT